MFRTTDMILIAVMVGTAGFTYKTKHDAEAMLHHLRRLEAQIRYEEDTIDLLKADWSLLTQPSRLQKLTETFAADLSLAPVEPRQIVGLDAVPLKPVPDSVEDAIEMAMKKPEAKKAETKPAAPAAKPENDPVVTGDIPE
ncbi:MAG: hypothetical protein DI629_10695 [Mesorhizobium amorphae]|nr:MAG: hypothetical protein DI629_10695 [Mesorhizobium amorphae]